MNDIFTIIIDFLDSNSLYNLLQTNKEISKISISSDKYKILKKEYEEQILYLDHIMYCTFLYETMEKKYILIDNLQNNKSLNKKDDTKKIISCSQIIKNLKKKMNYYWFDIIMSILKINYDNIQKNDEKILIYKKIEKDLNKIFHNIIIKYSNIYYLFS